MSNKNEQSQDQSQPLEQVVKPLPPFNETLAAQRAAEEAAAGKPTGEDRILAGGSQIPRDSYPHEGDFIGGEPIKK